jgi:hypothetical protein
MKVHILRTLGADTVRELRSTGLEVPDGLTEGDEHDVSDDTAKALISRGLAAGDGNGPHASAAAEPGKEPGRKVPGDPADVPLGVKEPEPGGRTPAEDSRESLSESGGRKEVSPANQPLGSLGEGKPATPPPGKTPDDAARREQDEAAGKPQPAARPAPQAAPVTAPRPAADQPQGNPPSQQGKKGHK